MRTRALVLGFVIVFSSPALAQHGEHGQHGASPYAGMHMREIKALSEEQVRQYLDGEGMGLAMAAELNRYPGPRHVLELAAELSLTESQIVETQEIQAEMKEAAVRLGREYIARERELDRAFAGGSVTEAQLQSLVDEIVRLHGEIRVVHLRAHIHNRALLSPEQIRRYDELRGDTAHPEGGSRVHGRGRH